MWKKTKKRKFCTLKLNDVGQQYDFRYKLRYISTTIREFTTWKKLILGACQVHWKTVNL